MAFEKQKNKTKQNTHTKKKGGGGGLVLTSYTSEMHTAEIPLISNSAFRHDRTEWLHDYGESDEVNMK